MQDSPHTGAWAKQVLIVQISKIDYEFEISVIELVYMPNFVKNKAVLHFGTKFWSQVLFYSPTMSLAWTVIL